MKYFFILLVFVGFFGIVYAQPIPEPTPVCGEGMILKNNACVPTEGSVCGPGTAYQEGICIVNEIKNSTGSSFGKWGMSQYNPADSTQLIEQKSVSDVIPPPLKQMKLGIKLGHIICDKDKIPVWNTHYKPSCVYSDSESELIKRGWAKLRLMLPAGPDPVKEMDWMGRNVMSMMLEGTFSYSSTPVNTLDEKRNAVEEYSEQYHQGEKYLEYSIIPYQYHYNVGDKVQFKLLEWGKTSDCSNLQLRIIDMYDQSMFEHILITGCVVTDTPRVIFNSYSMGEYFEEFVCDKSGYYRIVVSNGNVFPPTILQNFTCLDSEPELLEITPEPPTISLTDRNLIDANNKLREIYQINPSLGPFHFQDVIVGHGIEDGSLVVDVLDTFYDSDDDRKLIIKKIVEITNEKVDIEFNPSDGITPKDKESVFQYVWNRYLHKNNIQFTPQERSYANNDEGYHYEKDNKVCSPLVSSSGTELYISSTFTYEPFKITGTFIDETKPNDCQKIWKTDIVLHEPNRVLGLWLNDFFDDSRNNVFFTEYTVTEIDTHYSLDEPVIFEFTETGYGDPCLPIKIVYYQDRVWMENIVAIDKIIRDCPVNDGDDFLSSTFDTSKGTEFGKKGDVINFSHVGEYFVEITNENQRDGKVVASFVVE